MKTCYYFFLIFISIKLTKTNTYISDLLYHNYSNLDLRLHLNLDLKRNLDSFLFFLLSLS